ncbi:unknown [Spodoptera litura nucleopolyhedrovirus II]|uniref:hypothetical protein n=1 Tax=Spodoptera litura nucleopolyhedrovirus II TaxID=566270 RepID=UPI000187460E|nr:hypothetical protein SlnV2_gp114 [Spodoptera litura nucleopolyhedrovirus II]ACI47482.1 unknown [Spodoptera litura nucleopolyhedrovirus II]
MELIKPFLKYSRLYRSTTSKSRNVRKFIYKLWSRETQYIRDDDTLKSNNSRIRIKCLFCNEEGEDDIFCKHCFFPQLGMDEEFATYCLLSACFYESNGGGGGGGDVESQRTVYLQRLKMTWYDHERLGKAYEVSYPKCFQCHTRTHNVGAKFTYFNDAMFCSNCMFPLFNIVIYNIK